MNYHLLLIVFDCGSANLESETSASNTEHGVGDGLPYKSSKVAVTRIISFYSYWMDSAMPSPGDPIEFTVLRLDQTACKNRPSKWI